MLIFGELCNANMPMGMLNGMSHKTDYRPSFLRNLLIIPHTQPLLRTIAYSCLIKIFPLPHSATTSPTGALRIVRNYRNHKDVGRVF